MNTHFRPPDLPYTTRAAEGMERRLWTVAEIEAMVSAGIIDEHERFELIEGEVVPMSAKGIRHEVIKNSLIRFWIGRIGANHGLAVETTFRLSPSTFLEPDIVFYDGKQGLAKLSPSTALLAVEVAESSLRYDLGRKASVYADNGVKELWVIDATSMETHVFSKPAQNSYLERRLVLPDADLAPGFDSNLSVCLAELPLV